MNKDQTPPVAILMPTKSTALALLFSLLLGPIGMLYATIGGGLSIGVLEIIVFRGTPHILQNPGALIMLWVLGCLWAVIATNSYNRHIINQLMGNSPKRFWKRFRQKI